MNNVLDALEVANRLTDGKPQPNHPSHTWDWEFGRCMFCDCRPFGRWAPLPCEMA